MTNTSVNNRRIAKNTLLLYVRMFIMLFVSLFTSRIVLQVLGETDYGIYNIIGGVVVLFSFLNSALLSATQRFLNYNIGKKDKEATHNVFCMSMNAYMILAGIFFVLGETIGLWFVDTQLNIPEERMYAAHWVYQFSLITFIINLIRVPYNATIIAYERMGFFAYLSLAEVILKLLVVYLLYVTTFDKLIFYSLLYTVVPLLITCFYKKYCNRYFAISHYKRFWNKEMFKQLFSFSGWSLFGSIANLSANQGLNILINIFYGVTVNTAMGIANQISGHVFQFISNFQVAFNPQIVKTYASNETERLYSLMFMASKISYFLLLVISLPVMLNMNAILEIWLVNVPKYTAIFSQLILCFFLIEALSAPLWMFVQATGKIKNYQILMGVLIFLNLPLAYLVLKIGMPVYYVWVVRILVNVLVFTIRCLYVKREYAFPAGVYFNKVMMPVIFVTLIVVPISILIKNIIDGYWSQLFLSCLSALTISFVFIYILGLNRNEKNYVIEMVRHKMKKNHGN